MYWSVKIHSILYKINRACLGHTQIICWSLNSEFDLVHEVFVRDAQLIALQLIYFCWVKRRGTFTQLWRNDGDLWQTHTHTLAHSHTLHWKTPVGKISDTLCLVYDQSWGHSMLKCFLGSFLMMKMMKTSFRLKSETHDPRCKLLTEP